jgi:hypothetical protein
MFYDPHDSRSLEKYSSAITMSDMEIFIFPELMYALVLANILSPAIWKWLDDPWFDQINSLNTYRRLLRTKQFIMDRFDFNLDLDTWGLTTKEKELARFRAFIDPAILSKSNALFGYEGDRYYFSMDIRKHFGLDKYDSNVIPYWKTETVEAMEAFRHKEGYASGAGECVSLAALYASALFVISHIPLDDINLMATPLHSQNFIDIKDGILTNNRRIVTRNMWFNGTEISAKARRALENEQVTIVINNHGHIHTIYQQATMPHELYAGFSKKLSGYLRTNITFDILASFLRQNSNVQKCFQMAHSCSGKPRYIEIEKVFHYEHNSKSRIGEESQDSLLHEIEEDEFYPTPIPHRFIINELESFFRNNPLSIDAPDTPEKLKSQLSHTCYNVEMFIKDLISFCRVNPKLPATDKEWIYSPPVILDGLKTREEIADYLASIRATHPVADLAFMAYRDMNEAPWKPFLKAALERNPVCINGTKNCAVDRVYNTLSHMPDESIYDGPRLAQPDEVWNYRRGDGLEKAICFMNIMKSRYPDDEILLYGEHKKFCALKLRGEEYRFSASKDVQLPVADDFVF